MNRSESIGTLAKALAKAQGAIKPAAKGAENPFFKSSYADLPAIVKACRDELTKNDIAVIQRTGYEGETLLLETILAHSSGEWISGVYPVKPVKADPQGMGSAITYARRYALAAMVGVVAEDEDDDANAASGHARPAAGAPKPKAESREEKGTRLDAARTWANSAMHTIQGLDEAEREAWMAAPENAERLVKLRAVDPDVHLTLMKALQG